MIVTHDCVIHENHGLIISHLISLFTVNHTLFYIYMYYMLLYHIIFIYIHRNCTWWESHANNIMYRRQQHMESRLTEGVTKNPRARVTGGNETHVHFLRRYTVPLHLVSKHVSLHQESIADLNVYWKNISVTSHDHHGVSNHQHLKCLFNNLLKPAAVETCKVPHYWPFMRRVRSPEKRQWW